MPNLLVRFGVEQFQLQLTEGQSVRDALDSTELRVRAACGGTGSCGACLVNVLSGAASAPTVAEFIKLTIDERNAGQRLACQLRPKGDLEILLDQPAPPSRWKSIPAENLAAVTGNLPGLQQHFYGVAVDLGTTHIRVALWDRKHGKRVATRYGPNPQAVFGADVLNRLDAARARPERAAEMAKLARTAIIQAVRDILARDVGEVSPMLAQIGQVMIVGNTAMLALLSGQGGEQLVDPEYWQQPVDYSPVDPAAWQAQWYMPNAGICLPPPVAGFVGSDLLADLLATRITEGSAGALVIDIGTNTEIALWDGAVLHVTSAPGGPAFEAVGIRHGMPAELGAITRVGKTDNRYACETVGGGEARGYCGSGLADAIAVLLAEGVIKQSGRFAESPGPEGLRLVPQNARTAITGADIDAFQRAKAAMGAAMCELLELAGMQWADVRRVFVCGAFGRMLNVAHAQSLGLLPPLPLETIELVADASLAGCEAALLSEGGVAAMQALTTRIKPINLSLVPAYEERYIDHLRLRPMVMNGKGNRHHA